MALASIEQQPHAAILSSPGMGHLIPSLELSKRLITLHGVRVSFLVITTGATTAQSQLLDSLTLPHGLRIIHLPPTDITGLVQDDTPIVTRISITMQESLPAIRSALSEMPRSTVLIGDLFCTDAFDVAEELSMPAYVFFTTTARALAFFMHLPVLDREVEGEFIDAPEPLPVPGCDPMPVSDLLDQVRDRKADEYKWFLHHVSRYRMADGILVNTGEPLERRCLAALRHDLGLGHATHAVGPLVKSNDEGHPLDLELETECMTWLDSQPPDSVLYVSFGSGGTLSAQQVDELAWGLRLSQQRFLWVSRPPLEARAFGKFFSAGREEGRPLDYLPGEFLSQIQGLGFVLPSWAPQMKILAHPSIGGFLTHCGWNSILESLVHGVPMIVWPLYAEQRMNATMLVEHLGVAMRLVSASQGVVEREEIGRVVRMVMAGNEGERMKAKVGELKDQLSKAMEEGGCSYNSLRSLVDEWKYGEKASN